jgi:hypothetical protein
LSSASSLNFIQRKFAEYYEEHGSKILPPPAVEKREFGFLMFKEKMMIRHKAFKGMEDFASFVKKVVPPNVYYSGAYYERPEAEMDEKGWLGADLIFDIDTFRRHAVKFMIVGFATTAKCRGRDRNRRNVLFAAERSLMKKLGRARSVCQPRRKRRENSWMC